MTRSIRTLIVASTERLRLAYRDLLARDPGFEIVAIASRDEARALTSRHLPDLLIFALEPADLRELSLLREIEAASPRTHVFFTTLSRQEIEALKPRGSNVPFVRNASEIATDLIAALRPADPTPSAGPDTRPGDGQVNGDDAGGSGLSTLTPREREVLRMAAEGMSSTETGRQLGISARTAECHRAHGMRKLGLHRRADLVRFAMTAGLVGGRTDLR